MQFNWHIRLSTEGNICDFARAPQKPKICVARKLGFNGQILRSKLNKEFKIIFGINLAVLSAYVF